MGKSAPLASRWPGVVTGPPEGSGAKHPGSTAEANRAAVAAQLPGPPRNAAIPQAHGEDGNEGNSRGPVLYQMLACRLQNKAVILTVRTIQRDWASALALSRSLAARGEGWTRQGAWRSRTPASMQSNAAEPGSHHGVPAPHWPPGSAVAQSASGTHAPSLANKAGQTPSHPLLVNMSPGLRFSQSPACVRFPARGLSGRGRWVTAAGARCPGG